ncbi:MAG: hypothetical protein LBV72_08785 [Tannerella sp.]|jgi:hypothetical protein|nr:hypothetical protein [Tannerella sp.]
MEAIQRRLKTAGLTRQVGNNQVQVICFIIFEKKRRNNNSRLYFNHLCNGICFSPHYYKEYIIRDAVGADNVKSIAIDGIYPDTKSIKNKTYPFVANVYVSIRSNTDSHSMTYKLYEWLQTEAGQHGKLVVRIGMRR